MIHTSYGADHLSPLPQRAVGYDFVDGTYRLNPSSVEPLGDGGVRTTVGDMMLWLANLQKNRLGAHPGRVAELEQSTGKRNDGGTVPYAFGLGVSQRNGFTMFEHTGAYAGYQSFVAWLPAAKLGLVSLCNADGAPFSAWSLGLAILELYVGHAAPAPPPIALAPAVTLEPAQRGKLGGMYTEADGTVWKIATNNAITAHVQGLTFILQPVDQTHLVAIGAPQPVELVITASGLALKVGNGPEAPLTPFVPPVLSAKQLAEYAGAYRSDELNLTLRVYAVGGKLYAARDLSPPQLLVPVGVDRFTIGPQNLAFYRSGQATVAGLVLSASGVDELLVPKQP